MIATENPFDKITFLLLEVKERQDRIESKLDKIKITDQADDLLTRFEKAKQLNVSLPTLRNWELQGLIHPIRIGRKVYFKKGVAHPKAPSQY